MSDNISSDSEQFATNPLIVSLFLQTPTPNPFGPSPQPLKKSTATSLDQTNFNLHFLCVQRTVCI
jgi:hypothetical protein